MTQMSHSNDEDSKIKSYITRQFKKFIKNANGRNFDKDHKKSSSSQFKGQDKGKNDAKESGQYTVPVGPTQGARSCYAGGYIMLQ